MLKEKHSDLNYVQLPSQEESEGENTVGHQLLLDKYLQKMF